MAVYPTAIDSFTTHAIGDVILPTYDNAQQIALVALETKVGINSSPDTSSMDYKLSLINGGNQALPNVSPIITTPTILVSSHATGDMYYDGGSGVLTRLPIGSTGQVITVAGGLPTYATPAAISNASATVKGIVEIATAAEITAGTATGGTGAILAISPDQLALSTPIFNGSGLTSVIAPPYTVHADENSGAWNTTQINLPTSASLTPWTTSGITFSNRADGSDYSGASAFSGSAPLAGTGSGATTLTFAAGKSFRVKMAVAISVALGSGIKYGFGIGNAVSNFFDETNAGTDSVRFVINNASLFAVNSNGASGATVTASANIASGITLTNLNIYEIVYTTGVDAKFYVNGVLKATLSASFPVTSNCLVVFATTGASGLTISHPTFSRAR